MLPIPSSKLCSSPDGEAGVDELLYGLCVLQGRLELSQIGLWIE
jgi:hypothetical protein